jgi:O-antigen biosynthesis protein WbqV
MRQNASPHLLRRMALNLAVDGASAALGVAAAWWLAQPSGHCPPSLAVGAALVVWLIALPSGFARLQWRFVSFRDLVALALAGLGVALLLTLLMLGAGFRLPSPGFPVILALVESTLLTLPKLLYRLWRERLPVRAAPARHRRAILVGSGEEAELFLAAHARAPAPPYRICGLIALSPRFAGGRMAGLDIIASLDDAEAALRRLTPRPDLLIITASVLTGPGLRRLLGSAAALGLTVLRTPSLTSLGPAQGVPDLAPIAIEDLLQRPQVPLDMARMAALITGARVLVTGAGGSIGAELTRQVAALAPAELLLLDSSEYALWQIDLELAETAPHIPRQAAIADIRDQPRITALCQAFAPDLVLHAAALKHVPIVEANPLEALRTNALGTRVVADAAAQAGARLMVLISTDKAVNPASIMGASKRLAELYAQAQDVAARHTGTGLRVVTVRFGNVLGSTGSVVELFRRQLAQGGPLTITAPEMRRYFMTAKEAVGLCLEAASVGADSAIVPEGGIFVLDMGEPLRILDLARQMIQLAGLRPETDIKIEFTGIRPGEKLFEQLFHGAETPRPTALPGLLVATPRRAALADIRAAFDELAALTETRDEPAALALLQRLVPEFLRPSPLAERAAAE